MQVKNDPNNVSLLCDFVWFQLEEAATVVNL